MKKSKCQKQRSSGWATDYIYHALNENSLSIQTTPQKLQKVILRTHLVFCDVLAILHISTFVLIFMIFMLIIIHSAILIINIVFPLLLLLIIIIIIFMIIIISKVSSAILLANVGLLLGGFALTNIDKVIMIKLYKKMVRC